MLEALVGRGLGGSLARPRVDAVVFVAVALKNVPKQLAQVIIVGRLEEVQRAAVSQVRGHLGCETTGKKNNNEQREK